MADKSHSTPTGSTPTGSQLGSAGRIVSLIEKNNSIHML